MNLGKYLIVTHNGNNRGKIYLGDLGRRYSLGGSRGICEPYGQDGYIQPGQSITLIQTGEVLMSAEVGILKKYADLGVFTLTFTLDGGTFTETTPNFDAGTFLIPGMSFDGGTF